MRESQNSCSSRTGDEHEFCAFRDKRPQVRNALSREFASLPGARLDENMAACQIKLSPETMSLLEKAFAPQAAAGLRYTPAAM